MKHILAFCTLLFTLCIVSSPVQSWEVYNRSTAADSDLLDGLDSTAFTLDSSFAAYTSIAGNGDGDGAFVSYTTVAGTSYVNITTQIHAGEKPVVSGNYAAVLGGYSNTVSNNYTIVSGGRQNTASGLYAVVGGGRSNITADTYGTVAGGYDNQSRFACTIGGGASNDAIDLYATIAGGSNNLASGQYSAISGGGTNEAIGIYSFVGGGLNNEAIGNYAAVLGGQKNIASGDYSMLLGRYGYLDSTADRSSGIIYGASTITISDPDVHVIYGNSGFEKKVGIQTLTPQYELDVKGDIRNTGSILFDSHTTVLGNYSASLGDYTVFVNASSAARDMYLPDATTVDGIHVRFKKIDSSGNHVTINAAGGQTINGGTTKVLEAENNAIMLFSDGSNWEVLQATSVAHYGEIHVHDNATATTIDTANTPHLMQGLFAEEDAEGFSFAAGSTGPIASFADYSATVPGAIQVVDTGHGLSSGTIVSLGSTEAHLDSVYEATVIDGNSFYVLDNFSATGTGNWHEGDKLINNTGKIAKHMLEFHGFGTPETNNDIFEFHLYKNTTEIANLESKGKFTSATDVKPMSASGLITCEDGDIITVSITNTSGAGDFTMEHINVVIHSF